MTLRYENLQNGKKSRQPETENGKEETKEIVKLMLMQPEKKKTEETNRQ